MLAKAQAADDWLGLVLRYSSTVNPCLSLLPVRATGYRTMREEIRKLHVLSKQDQ